VHEEYGVTILFVTHDIDEVVYTADRVVVPTHAPTVLEILPITIPFPRDQIETKALQEFAHCARTSITDQARRGGDNPEGGDEAASVGALRGLRRARSDAVDADVVLGERCGGRRRHVSELRQLQPEVEVVVRVDAVEHGRHPPRKCPRARPGGGMRRRGIEKFATSARCQETSASARRLTS
jgi:hypothetical protein